MVFITSECWYVTFLSKHVDYDSITANFPADSREPHVFSGSLDTTGHDVVSEEALVGEDFGAPLRGRASGGHRTRRESRRFHGEKPWLEPWTAVGCVQSTSVQELSGETKPRCWFCPDFMLVKS